MYNHIIQQLLFTKHWIFEIHFSMLIYVTLVYLIFNSITFYVIPQFVYFFVTDT